MTFQDDNRENELIRNFNLQRPENFTRSGVDAVYNWMGREWKFELKSTSTGSVSTARDAGLHHTMKWRRLIWIVGVYSKSRLEYSLIIPPDIIRVWVNGVEGRINKLRGITRKIRRYCQENSMGDEEMGVVNKILGRGETLNNPKIGLKYLISLNLPKITGGHEIYLQRFLTNMVGNG